jgi:DNA repair protein RecN (Recombination protein N)
VLTQLSIQGLAIIDTLSIEFSRGFNVITGETGAGKSILIKALGLLLGAKASAETVRRGRENASVTGLFEVPIAHRARVVLEEFAIPVEPEGDFFPILVRRTVNSRGRSLAWINDTPVTASMLKDFASALIDVFGQHDNLRLLDATQHTAYVDQFVKDRGLLVAYEERFAAAQTSLGRLTTMVEDFRAKRRDADYLTYRCDEMRKFAPTREDYEAVLSLTRRGGNTLALVSGLEQAQGCVDQGAGGEALSTALWEASRLLTKLEAHTPDFRPLAEEAAALATRVDDLSFDIGKAVSGMEVDETDLEEAQDRLAGYQDLFRKLAVHDIDQLVAEQERLLAELGFLESAAGEIAALLEELGATVDELRAAAAKLTKARLKAKAVAKGRVEAELHDLAMPGATIDIEFAPINRPVTAHDLAVFGDEAVTRWAGIAEALSTLGDSGAERAQFLLSANPGEPLLPIQKFASGGEISRIMLAIKKALAAGADTCILVFDEIDTGISGRVADTVGRKMQELGSVFQVICISHLAQVAAYAETHFLVHKFGKEQRTESTISRLSTRESEEEVARLLSGQEVTTSSLANARALIKKARTKEKAASAAT